MNKREKIKSFFLVLIAAQLLLAHINLAYAQPVTNPPVYSGVSSQIELYLCSPSAPAAQIPNQPTFSTTSANGNNDLFTCINKLYRFAIAAGSVVAIFFIVIAGYLYMSADGAQETVDKAKSIFVSSITAMVILFAGYVLLRALNPDLLRFQSIQPPQIKNLAITPSTINSNFCQVPPGQICANSACDSFNTAINAAAQQFPISGLNTAALIKSIMANESGCRPNPPTSGADSWGLMQLQVATAQTYQSRCTTDTITQTWLTDASNSTKIICIGAHYLQDLSKSCNGVLNIAAGYNGGTKACAQSADCIGTGCDGTTTMRAWECPYDDTAHTITNTGYNESRNYAPKVLGCYQQFASIR